MLAWGSDSFGQVSIPDETRSGLVTAVAAGNFHSLALLSSGRVVRWGTTSNVPAAAQSGVTAIAAGGYHSLALLSNGAVTAPTRCWRGALHTAASPTSRLRHSRGA